MKINKVKLVSFSNGTFGVRYKENTVNIYINKDGISTMALPDPTDDNGWMAFESFFMMTENEARALFSSLKAADVKVDQRKTLTVTEVEMFADLSN